MKVPATNGRELRKVLFDRLAVEEIAEVASKKPPSASPPAPPPEPWWKAYIAPGILVAIGLGILTVLNGRISGVETRLDSRFDSIDKRLRDVETGLAKIEGSLSLFRAAALGFVNPQIQRIALRPGAEFSTVSRDAIGREQYNLTYTILRVDQNRITER